VVIFGLLGFGTPLLVAVGTTRYVDDNTCPATGNGTPASPFCRIQDAICAAVSGDTVSVAPGTYPEAVRMRPGVSLISQGGAGVTTINAANQPCVDKNGIPAYCVRLASPNRCSAVTFSTGHTLLTRLEGFTVTGGAGLEQTGSVNHVAGGGVYIFSSPTVANNVITNNVLSGSQRLYKGAGVYIGAGSPVITGNTITGNRAIPGPGISLSVASIGYGGGIWINFNADAVITSNIISGNRAGDPNVAYSIGSGGGIVMWPGDSSHPGPIVDRNLIADNYSDSMGGGITLGSQRGTGALAVVTNNVIVGNTTDKNGGGIYTYFNRSSTINNTITGNTAFLGGGIYTGQSDTTLPVRITNNIIEGNHLVQFGNGGGIYSLDLDPNFDPNINFNDLVGNDRNDTVIEHVEGTVIGFNGNFSLNPRFVNKAARDFHLDPNSPAIDTATAAGAPPVDYENQPRGRDGNGVPNDPVAGDVDVGAYEFGPSCVVSSEVCDGLDNDCDQLVDEGYPNTDGDLQADCVDPDDDNDGAADGSDCAPVDAGSYGMPVEVTNLVVTGAAPAGLMFDVQSIGTSTRYEVVVGLLSRLGETAGFQEDFCIAPALTGAPWQDWRPSPPLGDGWYYEVRSANACGYGTLGSALADAAGAGDVCAAGVVDADADGSPSDLDCNDANAAVSPLRQELCDGVDNNCVGGIDEGLGATTCGVGQCQRTVQNCVGGVSQTCTPGTPVAEVCDGLDNNCDQLVDEGYPNADGDLQADCVDPDDDNDGVADGSDCAPLNAGAWGMPTEVLEVDVQEGAATTVSWQQQVLGPATIYEVATGQIDTVGQVDFAGGGCVGSMVTDPQVEDSRQGPPVGVVWYYMVKARNICGPGTYGTPERDGHPACP
jgi:hypothetical protein